MKDRKVKELALWNVENLGYLTYYVAAKLTAGEIESNPAETFSAPRLGDYTIGDDSVVVLGPPEVFTADNIDQFNFLGSAGRANRFGSNTPTRRAPRDPPRLPEPKPVN